MQLIPFVKYTSCGNNFVIVDETENSILTEAEMSRFAHQATNISFGVGCDNLLVIQRCDTATLEAIGRSRPYWQSTPDASQADFIFRMFEPSGEEALCCGNGLMCVASHLYQQHGIDAATIMTEIPFTEPKTITIGAGNGRLGGWANLGHPRRSPAEVVSPGYTQPYDSIIECVSEIKIKFRASDLKAYSQEKELIINGYLVFTGEPHLVIFPDSDFSIPELADFLFGTSDQWSSQDQRESFGSWLVEHIGNYMNRHYRHLFPAGINVNFARPSAREVLENRCYERGIDRETLACGTGALAVAYVYNSLNALNLSEIDILPHRCRWHDNEAKIRVEQTAGGWHLSSNPVMLFEGIYRILPENNRLVEALSTDCDTAVPGHEKLVV
ncbi:MAG: diaminopimelate epimerase [Amphritea sp.]